MNRRTLIKRFGQLTLLCTPFSSKVIQAMSETQRENANPNIFLIYDSANKSSIDHRHLIGQATPYLTDRDSNWFNRLVIWDIQKHSEEVKSFIQKFGKGTQSFSWPILVRIPEGIEDADEVEIWTPEWLESRLRFSDACYPISGGWWSVEGDWNPTIQKVRNHLYRSPNHTGGKFQLPWLELLKFEELQSLHSDHHREMIHQGKVYWKNVNAECPGVR